MRSGRNGSGRRWSGSDWTGPGRSYRALAAGPETVHSPPGNRRFVPESRFTAEKADRGPGLCSAAAVSARDENRPAGMKNRENQNRDQGSSWI
ncbi:hypothetical protein FQA47_020175 [Oryzias melastigma]|uniref:Uncharacterized protein n=1 Tax=Oryzias melastigma TaxID=30732 RepID=A0A834BYS7_ORYME|nr:hypothetical protein FQA47_020175 [Oryzias melastigma]